MALVEVKVPDIGDFKEVEVIELLVAPGDPIAVDQSLVTVESDKASMEIPSSHAGVVKDLKVKLGDKVGEGSLLLTLEAGQQQAPAPASEPAPPQPAPTAPSPAAAAPAPSPQAAAPAARQDVELVVPDIGDFDDVAVIEVFIKPGDTVQAEQSLVTVESDKASMEIPSSHAGVVKDVRVQLGDKVRKGSVLAVIDAQAEPAQPAAPSAPVSAPAPTPAPAPAFPPGAAPTGRIPPTASLPPHEPAAPSGPLPHASPSIRRLARELGVPLAEVKGSGPKGRILQEDVHAFVKSVMSGEVSTRAQSSRAPSGGGLPGLLPWPQVDFAKFGPVERRELPRIRRISAANLHRNWVMIPHVTQHDDADITELEAFRVALNRENEKAGIKVTMLAFLIKASVAALKEFPEFNASLEPAEGGDQLVLKRYFNIGFAADTPNGLVVPVVKDADRKGVLEISRETSELAKKAREGKLSPADMSGGCFSISSLGGIGGRYFTPIINAPEVAILGVCRNVTEPVWDGAAFQPRLRLPLSLSYDHRVIDGAAAARFCVYLTRLLADMRRLML